MCKWTHSVQAHVIQGPTTICHTAIDTLEKEMATHSSILAWETTWAEEPGGPQSTASKESDATE